MAQSSRQQPEHLARFEQFLAWLEKIQSNHFMTLMNNNDRFVNIMNNKFKPQNDEQHKSSNNPNRTSKETF